MKKITYIVVICLSSALHAQQENLSTQFAFNNISINPAFSGFEKENKISASHRTQWAGLQGAPENQFLSYSTGKTGSVHAWGAILRRDAAGIQERFEMKAAYSFELKFDKRSIYLAPSFSVRRYNLDFTDPRLFAPDGFTPDAFIERERVSSTRMNVGIGILYTHKNFFAGFSIPAFSENGIRKTGNESIRSEEKRHIYGMLGGTVPINEKWDYRPSSLFKISENTPYNLDILNMLSYKSRLFLGINLRSGGSGDTMLESLDAIAGIQINDKLFASFSYDYTLSELNDVSNGSVEIMLQYCFNQQEKSESIIPDHELTLPEQKNSQYEARATDSCEHLLLEGETVIFENLAFDQGGYHLTKSAEKDLKDLVAFLQKHQSDKVQIISYTDSRGSDEENKIKTNRRANAIRSYLLSNGITVDRFISIGMGESKIRNRCKDGVECDEEEHSYNNRVEVKIIWE